MSATATTTAAAAITKQQVLSLYRHLLRSSSQFVDYNYREYAMRVTRDDFRKHQQETDPSKVEQFYQYGVEQLGVINRQTLMNQLYAQKLSIMDVNGRMDRVNDRGRNVQEDEDEDE